MALSRARKEELVAQYAELLENSEAVFVTDYTGMDVAGMDALRDKVYEAGGKFHVTKNTLLELALEQAGYPVDKDLFQGQIATGFALEEIPSMAKALVDFADEEDNLTIRGGLFGKEKLTVEEIESLAKLPSLEELRGQLVGLLQAPARNIVSTVTNGVRQVVNVIDAYAKREENEEAEAAA